MTRRAIVAAAGSLPAVTVVHENFRLGASDDATFLMRAVQGQGGAATYLVVGASNPAPHHSPEFDIDDELALECFRIPHFYRAFYVYKYATGLSAAIVLSERVLKGGKPELNAYLSFLKGGCSKWPLDLLRDAGVDMEKPEPVDTALAHFERLVGELDALV